MTTAAGPGSPERATRNAWKIAPGISAWWRTSIDGLDDRPDDRGVGQPVDLADRRRGARSMSVMIPTIGTLS